MVTLFTQLATLDLPTLLARRGRGLGRLFAALMAGEGWAWAIVGGGVAIFGGWAIYKAASGGSGGDGGDIDMDMD